VKIAGKPIVYGLLGILAFSTLAGCGGTDQPSGSPTATTGSTAAATATLATSAEPTAEATQGGTSSTDGDWKTFTSQEGKFSVDMPGTPEEDNQTTSTELGDLTLHSFSLAGNGPEYAVIYTDYPEAVASANPADILNGAITGAAQGSEVMNQTTIDVQGHPGVQGEFENSAGANYVWYKAIMANERQYQLIVATSQQAKDQYEDEAIRFLDSFKLTDE
jgi:hypothetical protein